MRPIAEFARRKAAAPAPVAAAFRADLERLQAKYAALWWASGTETPVLGERIDPRRQRRTERETDRLTDHLEAQLRACPDSAAERAAWGVRLKEKLRRFGQVGLAMPESHRDIIFSDDYFEVTAQFARHARAFDETLEVHDLFQALRNVWIMNVFQVFLDLRVSFSPAIFAYSMLYPYTDNYLDDPELAVERKEGFSRRLERRLAGERPPPRNPHEDAVFRLIALIEQQYPRREFPQVYLSLLAIHRAQTQSLAQQSRGASPYEIDVVGITMAKGGTSVLADGYLVAGELSPEEADFFFGYGTVLQLLDDLQDVRQDRRCQRATIFSQTARSWPLDRITSRLHHYLEAVLSSAERFSAPRFDALKELIRTSCAHLMLQAVAQNRAFYSARYVRSLERYSLTRFSYARKQRKTIMKRYRKLNEVLSREKHVHSVFEIMGPSEASPARRALRLSPRAIA
ncbi:MAG: hypothetical protein GY856_31880 [bacterium]|nr:hypothetical protein [bacterium]